MADDLDRILDEKYANVLRPGYKWYGDIFMLNTFPDNVDEILNFEVRDDDVFVSTFPKAGTTWAQEMVWLIANDLDYEGAKTMLPERFPYLDLNCVIDFRNYKKQHPDFECKDSLLNPVESINNMKTRRFIKTHMPWQYLPRQFQNQTTKAKIIYVIRNPKDTCVSYYHHTKAVEGATGTFEEFFRLFMANKAPYLPYWDSVFSYWKRRHLPNLLIITYEDMKRDLPSVIRQVAKFLDKEVRDDQMEKLTKHLSFEEMKKNRAVNYEPLLGVIKGCLADTYNSDGIFMRSGVVGSHKKQMTEEMIKIMDDWIEENTAGTDFKFAD